MPTRFEPTKAQEQALAAQVQVRYEDELKRWPKETTANYSYTKEKTGTKTATVVFYVGQMTFSADFKLVNGDSWYCTRDWRD